MQFTLQTRTQLLKTIWVVDKHRQSRGSIYSCGLHTFQIQEPVHRTFRSRRIQKKE